MAQRRPRDQRVVRNRRVAIYTFLLILTLFYISAHRTVQKERELEALRAETAAEGPGGQVKELAEGWPGGMPEEVVGGQTGGTAEGTGTGTARRVAGSAGLQRTRRDGRRWRS